MNYICVTTGLLLTPQTPNPPLYPSTNVFCRYTLHMRQAKRSCMERTCFLIDPSAKVFGMSNKVAPEPEKVTDEELLLASTDEDPKKKEDATQKAALAESTIPAPPKGPAAPTHGWMEVLDPLTQHYYYWNTKSNVTSWERPAELGPEPVRNVGEASTAAFEELLKQHDENNDGKIEWSEVEAATKKIYGDGDKFKSIKKQFESSVDASGQMDKEGFVKLVRALNVKPGGGSVSIEVSSSDLSYDKLSPSDLEKLVPIFLEDAADGNTASITQMLDLDSKTDQFSIIKQKDDEGRTALHKAAFEGKSDVLKLLLAYIAKDPSLRYLVDAPDRYGNSALFLTCMKLHKSDAAQAEYLIEEGADVGRVKTKTKMNILHWASYHGSSDLAQVIIKRPEGKANVFKKNKDGLFPIDLAGQQYMKKLYEESDQDVGDSALPEFLKGSTSSVYADLIKKLLSHGDDDQTLIEYQQRRLYWSCALNAVAFAANAIKYKATSSSINKNYRKQTPFHAAARHGAHDCLKLLLETEHAKEAINIRDVLGNTALIESVRMSNFGAAYRKSNLNIVTTLLEAGADDMILNRQNLRAFHYAKDDSIQNCLRSTPAAMKLEDTLPPVSWDWVLVFAKGVKYPGLQSQYEKVAKWLRDKKLTVDMFESMLNPNEVFVAVEANDKLLEESAEKFQYEVRVLSGREYRPYSVKNAYLFAPFRTQERMEITMLILEDAMDIDAYLAGGVMKRVFAVHDETELEPIRRRWVKSIQPFAAWKDYTSDKETNSMEDLSYVRSYYGEKVAFYYAWFCHYTATLTYIVPFGLAVSIYQYLTGATTSGYLTFYSIILVIWSTYHGETWKSKQEELAYRWDMLEFEREEKNRPEFRGDENINPKTGFVEKHYPESERRRKEWLSLPMLVTFAGGVVVAFVAIQLWKQLIILNYTGNYLTIMTTVASCANAAQIIVLDLLWTKLAHALADWENHRTDTEWEDSYIYKKFTFMLVNNTMSAFYVAFVERDISKLFGMMYSLIIVKQLTNVVKDVSIPLLKTWPKRHKLKKMAKEIDVESESTWGYTVPGLPDLSKAECVEARLEVCENDVMEGWGGTANEYSELMIQYAFVVLFSPAFPLAPVVAWLFNIIGIRGEMLVNTSVVQRAPTTGARDIGSWQTIQEGMCIASIVVNVGILLFTMDGKLGSFYESWFPSREAVVWSLIGLEHILLLVKVSLQTLINDKPVWVVEAIAQQQFNQTLALQKKKHDSKENAAAAANDMANNPFARIVPKATSQPKWGKLKKMMEMAMENAKQVKS